VPGRPTVLAVGGQDDGDDLRVEAPALRKQRPARPVDEREVRISTSWAAFALEVAAGDLSGGGGLLEVVAGEGQEVDALARLRRGRGGDQDHGVAIADDG